MDTNRDLVHQFQNEDNFATFSLGLEFLNKAEKEKSNGKGSISAVTIPRFTEQLLLIMLSVFRIGFDAQFHRLCCKTIDHAFSCALSSHGALGKFGEHCKKASGTLGYRLRQLLRFFRALQTSLELHNSIVHAKA